MDREQELIELTERKVAQGVTTEEQYADLNAARAKRKKRAERNLKLMMAGGYKQIPIIKT